LLHGEALGTGTHRLCRFAYSLVVDANLSSAPCAAEATSPRCGHVGCIAPATVSGSGMKLELSLNGQQYSGVSTRASPLERSHVPRFRYEPRALVDNLSPRGGPLAGGTLITLRGRGFGRGANYTCAFVNATDLSETIDARDGLLPSTRAVALATHVSAADGSGESVLRCVRRAASRNSLFVGTPLICRRFALCACAVHTSCSAPASSGCAHLDERAAVRGHQRQPHVHVLRRT
jgi:hypothetical protein